MGKSQRSLKYPIDIYLCSSRELALHIMVLNSTGRCSSLSQMIKSLRSIPKSASVLEKEIILTLAISPLEALCFIFSHHDSSVLGLSTDLLNLQAPAQLRLPPIFCSSPHSRHRQSSNDASHGMLGFSGLGLYSPSCNFSWPISNSDSPPSLASRPMTAQNLMLTNLVNYPSRHFALAGRGLRLEQMSIVIKGLVNSSLMASTSSFLFGITYHPTLGVDPDDPRSSIFPIFSHRGGSNPKPPSGCSIPRYQNFSCRGQERTVNVSSESSPPLERICSYLAAPKRGGLALGFLGLGYADFEILFNCGMNMFYAKSYTLKPNCSSLWERSLSLSMRGMVPLIELSMDSIYLLTALPYSVMVHTGPVEAPMTTPVSIEIRECLKSLFMLTTLRSVDDYGLKFASMSDILDLDILTSPDDLSSFIKLVSLSLSFACISLSRVCDCYSGLSVYAFFLVTI